MLAGRGYEVIAVSGKAHASEYLHSWAPRAVLAREQIDYGKQAA